MIALFDDRQVESWWLYLAWSHFDRLTPVPLAFADVSLGLIDTRSAILSYYTVRAFDTVSKACQLARAVVDFCTTHPLG